MPERTTETDKVEAIPGFTKEQTWALGMVVKTAVAEGVAPLVESLTGGRVFLRILSNLTDRSWLARTSLVQKISTRSRLELAFSKVGGVGEFTGSIPARIVDDIKRSNALPAGVGEALDRIAGGGADWTASVSAGVDL